MHLMIIGFMLLASVMVNWSYVKPEDLEFENDEWSTPAITGLEQPRPRAAVSPSPTPAVVAK